MEVDGQSKIASGKSKQSHWAEESRNLCVVVQIIHYLDPHMVILSCSRRKHESCCYSIEHKVNSLSHHHDESLAQCLKQARSEYVS